MTLDLTRPACWAEDGAHEGSTGALVGSLDPDRIWEAGAATPVPAGEARRRRRARAAGLRRGSTAAARFGRRREATGEEAAPNAGGGAKTWRRPAAGMGNRAGEAEHSGGAIPATRNGKDDGHGRRRAREMAARLGPGEGRIWAPPGPDEVGRGEEKWRVLVGCGRRRR